MPVLTRNLNFVFPNFTVKPRTINAQNLRSSLLVPACALESLPDDEAFDLLESHIRWDVEIIARDLSHLLTERQVFRLDPRPLGEEHSAFDGILQFPNISGPAMIKDTLICGLGKPLERPAIFLFKLVEEKIGEQLQVFTSLA